MEKPPHNEENTEEKKKLIQKTTEEYRQYKCRLHPKFCCSFKISKCSKCCNPIDNAEIFELLESNTSGESYKDKSAIISLILREKENEKFWDEINLKKIMASYIEDNKPHILKQFFSILMYDWHEYEKKTDENYFLIRKFQAFTEAFDEYEKKKAQTPPDEVTNISETTEKRQKQNASNEHQQASSSNNKSSDLSKQPAQERGSVHPQAVASVQPQAGTSVQIQTGTSVQPEAGASDQSQTVASVQPQAGASVQPQSVASVQTQEEASVQTQPQAGTSAQPQPSTSGTSQHKPTQNTDNKSHRTIFEKLFGVLKCEDLKRYHSTCLKIIYYYVDEVLKNFDKNKEEFISEISDAIAKVLEIQNNDEYKIKILKILTIFLEKNSDNDIDKLFNNINEFLKRNPASLDDKTYYYRMIDHCDRLFFNLIIYLKEDLIPVFKDAYKKYIEIYKSYFGDYWTFAIKENGRLLFQLTKIHELNECKMFILLETEESKLMTRITSLFTEVAEFQAVFNEPLDKNDEEKHNDLRKLVKSIIRPKLDDEEKSVARSLYFEEKNTSQIRRLLFGRKNFNTKSVFENILSHKMLQKETLYFDDLLNYIWNEFRLWETPQILTLKNSNGKRFIDYLFELEKSADLNKIHFLNVEHTKIYKGTQKAMKYMMLKSSLLPTTTTSLEIEAKNDENRDVILDGLNFDNFKVKNYTEPFVNFQLKLINETVEDDENEYEAKNLPNFLYLLEEMHQHYSNKIDNDELIKNYFKMILDQNSIQILMSYKYFYLGLMMIYWDYYIQIDNENSIKLQNLSMNEETESFLKSHTQLDPFLYLISLIVTKKYDQFVKEFPDKFKEMVKKFKSISTSDKRIYENISTNLCFILLYGGIKANQKEIVKQMFSFNSFLINIPEFPPNMTPGEIHSYAIKMYLEYKFQLGNNISIPDDWITHKVIKEFLDSRIECQDDFYKINCQFLLPHDFQDEISDKNGDDYVLNEDYYTIKYISESYKLKSLVTHPVIETVVRTKIEKYDRIFFWNLILFIILYIIPTFCVTYFLHSYNDKADPEDKSVPNLDYAGATLASTAIIWCSAIRIVFLSLRELLQLLIIYGWKRYFCKFSNWIEIILIVLCTITFVLFGVTQMRFYTTLTVLEAFNIVFMTFSTLNMYPILKFSIYIKCFFIAFKAYFYILCLLAPLSIGCILLIFILFNKANNGQIDEFHDFPNATMKYFIMYNGELGISADKVIGPIQVIAISAVIMFAITKSNLIFAIVLNDVQKILQQAKEITLESNAKKYIDFAQKIQKQYKRYNKGINEQNEQKTLFYGICFCIKRFFKIGIIKFLTRKYPHIHRLDSFYIDQATGYVHINEKRPLFENLFLSLKCWRTGGKFIRFIKKILDKIFRLHLKLDSDTMDEIKNIVENRIKNDSEADEKINRLTEENARLFRIVENLAKLSNTMHQKPIRKRFSY